MEKIFISNRTTAGSINLIFEWRENSTETGCTTSWGLWLSQVGRAFPREISAKQESEACGARRCTCAHDLEGGDKPHSSGPGSPTRSRPVQSGFLLGGRLSPFPQ